MYDDIKELLKLRTACDAGTDRLFVHANKNSLPSRRRDFLTREKSGKKHFMDVVKEDCKAENI